MPRANENPVPRQDMNVVAAANQFCLDLYARLSEKQENIFFSPYSIWTALAMTYEGARAGTAEQMERTLHAPDDPDMRKTAIKDLLTIINSPDAEYELNTANALWAQHDHGFLREYIAIIEEYYMGRAANLDFKTDAEGARKTINDWVADQTRQKIKDLIPSGALSVLTRLVLTNAIYFKADWQQRFEEAQTTDQPFFTSTGDTVSVPMMTMMNARFPYTETPEVQVLELPYSGDSLAMLVMLPRTRDAQTLEARLDTAHLYAWTRQLSRQEVDVFMPRFKLETKYNLNATLSDMGMAIAFSPRADFSGMNGRGDLFISAVIHQAFVEVNEEGTEAAAATGVMMETVSVRPRIEFRADHPFVFMIRDKRTQAILFMGRVSDPS
ncbi:serpin family protein [candidate division WOR-3 bacterium]|nr:serpin family protein [candidate division WOR-3 bacterium]